MSEQHQDFINWFREEFGAELTQEQAVEKRQALLGMMRIVYQPITEEQLKELQKWRKQRRDLKKINSKI